MATLATQPIERSGTTATYATASAGGDKFHPGDHTMLHVKNGGGSSVTVTVSTTATDGEFAVADLTVDVGAGADAFIGPLTDGFFRGTDGLGSITYSATTSVTVAVLRA